MSDELTRLRMENTALREMLEAATEQIHGEWGTGSREDYDWLPEMEQHICGQIGHRPVKGDPRRCLDKRGYFRRAFIECGLCGAWIGYEDLGA